MSLHKEMADTSRSASVRRALQYLIYCERRGEENGVRGKKGRCTLPMGIEKADEGYSQDQLEAAQLISYHQRIKELGLAQVFPHSCTEMAELVLMRGRDRVNSLSSQGTDSRGIMEVPPSHECDMDAVILDQRVNELEKLVKYLLKRIK